MKQSKKALTNESLPENKHIVCQHITPKAPVDNYYIQDDWYKTIVKSTSEGFILRDFNGNILDVNDATCSSLGYSREELLKMRIHDIACNMVGKTEEENLEILSHFQDYDLVPYGNCSFETQHMRKDGSSMDVFVSNGYLNVLGGLVFCFHRDITEQNLLFKQLKESEERYRTLIELGDRIGEAVVMLQDTEAGIGMHIFVSDAWVNITGYSREELFQKSFIDLIPSRIHESSIKQYIKISSRKTTGDHFEDSIIRKDGKEVPVEIAIGYTKYKEKPVDVLYIRDITERRKIEEALHFSDASFKAIKEGIVITDLEDNIINWNEASELIFGIKASMAIGKKLSDIVKIKKPSRSDLEKELIKLNDVGYTYSEYLIKTESVELWVDVSKQSIKNKYGDIIAILSIVSDITERKDLEAAIKKYQERLEKTVKERTIELAKTNETLEQEIVERKQAHAKLNEYYIIEQDFRRKLQLEVKEHEIAEKKLEEQDSQRAEFMRILVHELKTPLTPLLSMSDYLISQHGNQEQMLDYLKNINNGVKKLSKRIDELMDLSRGETGLLKIEHNEVDINSLLEDISIYMEPYIHKREQTLIRVIPESLPIVLGDEERLWQVVNNLLDNASKFTPKGGVIELCAFDNEAEIVIQIKNNGISLTEEQRQNLFKPYHSFHNQKDGLGLGLVLARMLVELHGGRIWVEDYQGKGNIFSFAIPVNPALKEKG